MIKKVNKRRQLFHSLTTTVILSTLFLLTITGCAYLRAPAVAGRLNGAGSIDPRVQVHEGTSLDKTEFENPIKDSTEVDDATVTLINETTAQNKDLTWVPAVGGNTTVYSDLEFHCRYFRCIIYFDKGKEFRFARGLMGYYPVLSKFIHCGRLSRKRRIRD